MMKPRLSLVLAAAVAAPAASHAATLSDHFEAGEDTSAWNSTWTDGRIAPGFLDPSLGGANAGAGDSGAETFSRSFRNNTAGLSVTTAYSISMYVRVAAFGLAVDGRTDGRFEIVDGAYGSANAANLGIRTEETAPGVYRYHWQARDNTTGWQDLGIDLDLATPYRVQFDVDPATFTYSATVQRVTSTGGVLESAGLAAITFDQNVIGNGQNGNLLFYVHASAGTTTALVDNINIVSVPEPSAPMLLLSGGAVALAFRRGRRESPASGKPVEKLAGLPRGRDVVSQPD